jgi:hypothetical protein
LRGNPRRTPGPHSPRPTRFKPWWDLVGSAIEFAADQHFLLHAREVEGLVADPEPLPPAPVDFARMFLAGEAEDEQQSSLAIVLEVLYREWPNGFRAANVAGYAARPEDATIAFRGALEHAGGGRELKIVTPTTVNWKLKAITDAPVDVGNQRLVLRYEPPGEGRHGAGLFRVKALDR